MNKIKIGEEYSYDTQKVESVYANYKICKCIKQRKFSTKKWAIYKNQYYQELENYKYITHKGSYVVFLEDDYREVNTLSVSEFANYFCDIVEWRNKQISNII